VPLFACLRGPRRTPAALRAGRSAKLRCQTPAALEIRIPPPPPVQGHPRGCPCLFPSCDTSNPYGAARRPDVWCTAIQCPETVTGMLKKKSERP